MSELKDKLQQRLVRARSVHQELIQPVAEKPTRPAPEDYTEAPDHAPSVAQDTPVEAASEKSGPGRKAKLKRKVTTLYFDEDLDKALEIFLLHQYLNTGTKTSKSEWIRNLVEASLREHNAWPPQSKRL